MTELLQQIERLSQVVRDPKKHLLYYRHSLADGERMDISASTVKDKGCWIPAVAEPSEALVQRLFADASKEETKLNILYCPLCLQLGMKDGVKPGDTAIYPFWIPAVLQRSGVFNPPQNETTPPWLIRGVLAPNDYLSHEYPVLSSVEQVDLVGAALNIPHDNWDVYLAGALGYFKDQVGQDVQNLKVEGWTVSTAQIALVPADLKGLTTHLLHLYDHYLEQSTLNLPGTLQSLISPRTTPPQAVKEPVDTTLQTPHYGQMASSFPLSPSQRISLALFNKTGTNQVFAVNGPPGTGKTTLIQSVVADVLVKSFLATGKPPLIVGSSVNNKAITNILDSFASVTPRESLRTGLNERWLPELNVLGHYLVSNSNEKQETARAAGYWVSTAASKKDDNYLSYCEAHSKSACETYFTTKFRTFQKIDTTVDLPGCYKIIKDTTAQLRTTIDDITQSMNSVRKFIAEHSLDEVEIGGLGIKVEALIGSLRENRMFLEALINREHLSPTRPWFLLRWIEQFRFGTPQLRRARLQSALMQHVDLFINIELPDFYDLAIEVWKHREQVFHAELKLLQSWKALQPEYESLSPYIETLELSKTRGPMEWIEAVQGKLDVGERNAAFWWALHGLECQWLIQRNDDDYRALNQGQGQSIQRWAQRAFLTPVFVSTFHSLPNFFSYKKKTPQETWLSPPLTESIDLLVVDEAGQAAPELGLPVFGLAKKAVVVGDVRQLEPIWKIPSEPIDFSNCRRVGIVTTHLHYKSFAQSRRSSVNGSLMVLAQDAAAFLYPPQRNEAGSLLVEHRRCAPAIIEFCNRFVYQSMLDIKTKTIKSEWPALGYCHIDGVSQKSRSTQSNHIEAREIAAWIQKNKAGIIKKYHANLADVVAIVTPFRGQQYEIIEALKALDVYEKKMVVGTVHSLQGAEKPIVIFSPVYDGHNHQSGSVFFNQSYNMLNVAVSRAKDHFLVFGNMELFKMRESRTPANDLGSLLFQNSENEIKLIQQ